MRWLEGQILGWDFGAMHRWWDYPHGAYNGIQHIRWRRKWQPTPVFLPGEFHGQGSLVDYSPWDCRIGHDWAHSIQHIRQRQRYGQWELEWLERRWRVRRDVLQIEKAGAGGPVERELPMADCTESQERVTAVKNEDIIDGITLLYKHSGHISPVPISWGVKVEMVGWHHRPDGREFEQTPGVGDGQEAWSAAVPCLAVTKITKYWLYSLRCATRAWACLTLGGLCLPHPRISPRPSFPPLLCSLYLWVCFFFVIFTSLLYFLDSTFKWYCLCLTYFPYYNAFEVHPCCSKWQNFVLFYRWILFRCVYLSIHSFTDIQSGCFLVLARKLPSIVNNASKHLFKWKIWRTYPDKHARAVSYFFFLRVKHCNCHRLAPGMSALR